MDKKKNLSEISLPIADTITEAPMEKCRICGAEGPFTAEGFCYRCHNKEIEKRSGGLIATLILKDISWERERFYVTVRKGDTNHEQHVFYFAEEVGRRIISAIYKNVEEIVINGKQYSVVEVINND